MLITALFLVVFSNHMEERLADGKSVLSVSCHITKPPLPEDTKDEQTPLVSPGRVSLPI